MLYFTIAAAGEVTSNRGLVWTAAGTQWLRAQFNLVLQKTTPLAIFCPVLSGPSAPRMAVAPAGSCGPVATPAHTPNSSQLVGALEAWRNQTLVPMQPFWQQNQEKSVLLRFGRETDAVIKTYRWPAAAAESSLHRKINSTGVLGTTKTDHAEGGKGNLTKSKETLIWGAYGPPGISRGTQHWLSPLSILMTSGVGCPTPMAQSNVHTHPWRQPKENGYLHWSVRSWKYKWSFSQKKPLNFYTKSW